MEFLKTFTFINHWLINEDVAVVVSPSYIADKLIESGWVEVDKPFECWEIRHKRGAFIQDFKSEYEAKVGLNNYPDKEEMKIIHVKEVLEGSEG